MLDRQESTVERDVRGRVGSRDDADAPTRRVHSLSLILLLARHDSTTRSQTRLSIGTPARRHSRDTAIDAKTDTFDRRDPDCVVLSLYAPLRGTERDPHACK